MNNNKEKIFIKIIKQINLKASEDNKSRTEQ